MTDKPENERGELPGSVQEAVDSYARYYADHHKLGMSIREDMTYIAQVAMRWCVPVDAAEIEAAADELRWYAKHLGDFHGKPNKPWTEHFNDDINALRNMALVEKERADRLAALTAQPAQEPVAWTYEALVDAAQKVDSIMRAPLNDNTAISIINRLPVAMTELHDALAALDAAGKEKA